MAGGSEGSTLKTLHPFLPKIEGELQKAITCSKIQLPSGPSGPFWSQGTHFARGIEKNKSWVQQDLVIRNFTMWRPKIEEMSKTPAGGQVLK